MNVIKHARPKSRKRIKVYRRQIRKSKKKRRGTRKLGGCDVVLFFFREMDWKWITETTPQSLLFYFPVFLIENFFFCAFALLLCPVRLMELEVSINRYKPGRKFNWSQRNWTPKKSIGFFFREKDGCVFFWKRVWWSGHIWGRLEIWWNKKNKLLLLLLLRFQRLVYIFSLHGVSTKSRFQRESLLFSASPAATTTPTTTNHQKTTTIDQKFFVSFGYWCCCCCPCCCRLTAKQIHHAGIISIELYLPN